MNLLLIVVLRLCLWHGLYYCLSFVVRVLESEAKSEGGAALFAVILSYSAESEAKCEGVAALFAVILSCSAESEAKCAGGAALFAAIMEEYF